MDNSWKLGRIAGIDVHIHWTFILLPAWIALGSLAGGGSLAATLASVIFVLAVFGCVLLHELGHALAAERYGIVTHNITLLPIGGVARLDRMPERPSQELVVALAGPAVNVAIAGALLAGFWLSGSIASPLAANLVGSPFLVKLMWVNVMLVLFNLLPAFPMDGGRVLRALLATQVSFAHATRIAALCGQAIAVALAVLGLLTNWMLVFVAAFVFLAARSEAAIVATRASIGDARVRDAMLRQFHVLPARTTVGDATRALLATCQRDFPVVEGHQLVGMLSQEDLLRTVAAGADDCTIAKIMRRDVPALDEDDVLAPHFTRMLTGDPVGVPVVLFGQVVGMLTEDSIQHWLKVRSARRAGQAARAASGCPRTRTVFRSPARPVFAEGG